MLDMLPRECEHLVLDFMDVMSLVRLSEVANEANQLAKNNLKGRMMFQNAPETTVFRRAYFESKFFPNGLFENKHMWIKLYDFITDPQFWDEAENEDPPDDVEIQDPSERILKVFGWNSAVLTDLGNVYAFAKQPGDRFPQQVSLVAENVLSVSVHETDFDRRAFLTLPNNKVMRCPVFFTFPKNINGFTASDIKTQVIPDFDTSSSIKLYTEMYMRRVFVTTDNMLYYNRMGFMPTYRRCPYFFDNGINVVKILLCGESTLVVLTDLGKVFSCSRYFGNKDVHPKYGVFQSIKEVQLQGKAKDIFKKHHRVTSFNSFYVLVYSSRLRRETIFQGEATHMKSNDIYDM